ncbi:MAG: hypothetical protein ABSF28_06200 [Terracidiphilus sp.]|jgi:hypothetical protein
MAASIIKAIGVIAAAASSKILADEFRAWRPLLTKKLIATAVRRLPNEQRDRYSEEWSSYIEEVPGEIGKIFAAFGLTWAAIKIKLLLQREKRSAGAVETSRKVPVDLLIYALLTEILALDGVDLRQIFYSRFAEDPRDVKLVERIRMWAAAHQMVTTVLRLLCMQVILTCFLLTLAWELRVPAYRRWVYLSWRSVRVRHASVEIL